MKQLETRDEWIAAAIKELEPLFNEAGYEYPKEPIRGFCSFPTTKPNTVIGQAFDLVLSEGGAEYNCIVSPTVQTGTQALGVMVHEVAHVVVGTKHQHKTPFIRCARALGLVGKPTSTEAGQELEEKFKKIIDKIGEYPHTRLSPGLGSKATKSEDKEPTRVKLASPVDEKCFFWMCIKKYERFGAPLCPLSKKPMIVIKVA